MTLIRIGGVPEHFNLPWRLAIEERAFDSLGIDAEWVDFPGGTGAIMRALDEGEVDIATPLTEGAVSAIAKGSPSRIVRMFVQSPLLWGVHVASDSAARSIPETVGGRIAISRFGSGSELMGYVLAAELGWDLGVEDFVTVGGLEGARAALPAGDAEIFLWNKTMTQPHVDDGTFRRVGAVPTPWPSFATVASGPALEQHGERVSQIADIGASRAQTLAADAGAAQRVMDRYGLARVDVDEWLSHVRWSAPGTAIDVEMIESVGRRMFELGRIDHAPEASSLIG